jgi:flavin-binding protein dodecin
VAGHIYKKVELVGTSQNVISDAIQAAVQRASQSLQGLDWFEVKEIRGTIKDGRVDEYQVTVAIGFRVMSDDELRSE